MTSTDEQKTVKAQSKKKVLTTLNSTDALALIEHGSDVTLNMNTPVGTKFVCHSHLIGIHPDNFILTEIPQISKQDLGYYFQEGFWSNIRAISPRGEGAIIVFKSQLQHIIQSPIPMALFSIPNTMQVTQLRREPRFEVNLSGKAISDKYKLDCDIRDISRNGCRFLTSPLGQIYEVGDTVGIHLKIKSDFNLAIDDLIGTVCNTQRSTHYASYGIQFSEVGMKNAEVLLSNLKFTGTKLTFNPQKKH
ncbi:PilZ domain-containing protein [Vibrio sp. RC27]